MIVNRTNLNNLRVGFSTAFQRGVASAPSMWTRVATEVPSTTGKNEYGWLGELPGMRKWIGARQIKSLSEYDYSLKNEPYEETVGVKVEHIEDDNLAIYTPRFEMLGRSVGSTFDTLVFAALKGGFSKPCYDGQNFFDTDHPVLDENGVVQSVANTDGGSGAPWFLIDKKQPINPLILQMRKKPQFITKDDPKDDHVFMNNEVLFGADGRWAVGYGFWQWCWGSKQTLDATHYAAARAALGGMKGDYGRPVGVMPDLLVVGPSNESAGRKLLNNELSSGGETNEWKGTAELLVVPWLA